VNNNFIKVASFKNFDFSSKFNDVNFDMLNKYNTGVLEFRQEKEILFVGYTRRNLSERIKNFFYNKNRCKQDSNKQICDKIFAEIEKNKKIDLFFCKTNDYINVKNQEIKRHAPS
jgi:hypothetical protein